jgi:CRP/FNR family cyclic AMP-dependent transcriptional regulator
MHSQTTVAYCHGDATQPTSVLEIAKREVIRVIHEQHKFSDRFVAHMRKRKALVLLLVARYGNEQQSVKIVAKVSQEALAEMIGTTRSRVRAFMNKFGSWDSLRTTAGCTSTIHSFAVIFHN